MKLCETIDWIDTWRNGCAHSQGRDRCAGCASKKECDKAIGEIRKKIRGK